MGGYKTPGIGQVSSHPSAGISPGTQQGPRRGGSPNSLPSSCPMGGETLLGNVNYDSGSSCEGDGMTLAGRRSVRPLPPPHPCCR